MYNNFIYTPPEIIAREVKHELGVKPAGKGFPSSMRMRSKVIGWGIIAFTSPIWIIGFFLILCSILFG